MHHPKADVERVYLPRNEGDGCLIQLEATYKTASIGLDTNLNTKNNALLVIAQAWKNKEKEFPS